MISDDSSIGSGPAEMPGLARRPRLGFSDLLLQLWRAKGLMTLVFLPIFALGLAAAFIMPKTYTAEARLLVALGDEYVYRPSVGANASSQSIAPELDALIQSELELIRSPVVSGAVIDKFDLKRLYPDLQAACSTEMAGAGSNAAAQERLGIKCRQLAIEALRGDFGAGAAPKTPVVTATFTHKDPAVATEVLNALIGAYLSYRSNIFAGSNSSGLASQREQFETSLGGAEEAIRAFLVENGLGSFDGERATVEDLYRTASTELLTNESRLRQVKGQLEAYRRQIASVPQEQDIYVEDSSEQALLNLKLERQEKLTRYQADSRIIKELDKRIEETESYLRARDKPAGTVRRGPNPLYAQIESSINSLQSEADSLVAQQQELRKQVADFDARLQRLIQLQPAYSELVRKRDLFAQNVRGFAEREIEANAQSQLVQQSVDNIRPLGPATVPVEGSSMKLPVAILAFLFAAFTALMAGLLRAFTRNAFSTARSVERTLGLPVMANVREY